jgi:hypothetical protein
VDHIVLPYARRVAGDVLSWSFDPASRVLDVSYADRAGTRGATEIFVPDTRKYPDGWHVEVSPDGRGSWVSSWDGTKRIVSVTVGQTGALHHVRIAPGGTAR